MQAARKLISLCLIPAAVVSKQTDLLLAKRKLNEIVLRFQELQSLGEIIKQSEELSMKDTRIRFHFVSCGGSEKPVPEEQRQNLIEVVEIQHSLDVPGRGHRAKASFYDPSGKLYLEMWFVNGGVEDRKEIRSSNGQQFEFIIRYVWGSGKLAEALFIINPSGGPRSIIVYRKSFLEGWKSNWQRDLQDVTGADLTNLKQLFSVFEKELSVVA